MSKDWLITIFENEVKIVMKAEYKAENINATELLLRYAEPEKFILPKEHTNDFGDVGYDSKSMKVFESYDLVGTPISYGHIIHINGQYGSMCHYASSELFLGWPAHTDTTSIKTPPIYYRAHSDKIDELGWTPWRRLVYEDEVVEIVNSVLAEKGLI